MDAREWPDIEALVTSPQRHVARLALAACLLAACASHRPEPAIASEPPPSEQWVDLRGSGPPTTPVQLRDELVQRRNETLSRCDVVVSNLEDRQRAMGSIPSQVATGLATQVAASIAQSTVVNATGRQAPTSIPAGAGVNIQENVRVRTRISNIRAGMHDLATARTNRDLLDALDRLGPLCIEH